MTSPSEIDAAIATALSRAASELANVAEALARIELLLQLAVSAMEPSK